MDIVLVHNFYQTPGGEDESFHSEKRLLRDAGHSVVTFTEHNERVKSLGRFGSAIRTVWSREAQRGLLKVLRQSKAQVVHVQNFFPLISPSVYYAARKAGVPVVQSLRNYRLLCPVGLLFRDGRVCEDCVGRALPWPGIKHACYRASRAATAAVATMISAHRLLGTWSEMVDIYIALTEFSRRKFIQGGLPPEKIVVKSNFVYPDPGPGEHRGGYLLFAGRLSPEKGIGTLLKAWEQAGTGGRLLVAGDGPMQEFVRSACGRIRGVEYIGPLSVEEVYDRMGDAEALVFPSEWYETFGRVAAEAFAKGTPVIAGNIGAVGELVEDCRTGLLFKPGDSADLAAKIEWAGAHPRELAEMRSEARREYEAKFTGERNYHELMAIYAMVVSRAQARAEREQGGQPTQSQRASHREQ
jgi:glycosyltransferase involved in cell wall biosynthesis